MLEIKKSVVAFDEHELIDLERIVTDLDKNEALKFLKKSVYDKILHAQQGKLKSHLDSGDNPAQRFTQSRQPSVDAKQANNGSKT